MAKKLDFKDFLNVDYTQGATGQESKNAKKRKMESTYACGCGPDCKCEGQCNADCDCGSECSKGNVDEALTLQQRMKRSRQMKKYASRIKIGREKAARRTADPKRLKRRAQKQARNMIAKKLAKGDYASLSFARKQEIEKRLDKLKPRIERIAKKLLPKMRKLEQERKRGKSGASLDRANTKND